MPIIKKLIILLIFVIFAFVIYKLMIDRRAIKTKYGIEGFREGALFTSSTIDGELAAVKAGDVPASTTDAKNVALPLKQYCIKGSYNSALTGYFINTEMIKYMFYRGCRFLDFELFSFDDEPYVAMSTDNTYSTIDTSNKVRLTDILTTIATYAFLAPSTILKDPVFIHFRIKTNNEKLYDKIGSIIENVLINKMYLDESGIAIPVNGDTILGDIREKVIIVLDKIYAPNYKNSSILAKYVNMESGYEVLRKYGYSELSNQQYMSPFVYSDGITTDVSIMKMVMPDMINTWTSLFRNANYYPMVLNYGAQIVLYPFYKVDMYLGDYEKAFADNKTAFVPMGKMITYLQEKLPGDSSVKPRVDVSGAAVPSAAAIENPFSTA